MVSRFYFILYEVDAPLKLRFERFTKKYKQTKKGHDISSFVDFDDKLRFTTEEFGLYSVDPEHQRMIKRRFHNSKTDLQSYYQELDKFDFQSKELIRPCFNTYFMRMADLCASRSNCMKRGVGCVIVKDSRVVSTGYNGTPVGMVNCNEGGCKRCNSNAGQGIDLDKCLCLHAEESAIMEAGRERAMGATIFTTLFPCALCTRKIVQCGIKKCVYR